jgi:hypothetical protein
MKLLRSCIKLVPIEIEDIAFPWRGRDGEGGIHIKMNEVIREIWIREV